MTNKTSKYLSWGLLLVNLYLVNATSHLYNVNKLNEELVRAKIQLADSEINYNGIRRGDRISEAMWLEQISIKRAQEEVNNLERKIESEKRKALTII